MKKSNYGKTLLRSLIREFVLAEGDDLESYRADAVRSLVQQKWLLGYAESVLRRKVLEVAVVGSILRPGRFTESSDADIAFSVAPLAPGEGGLDEELSLELQQALVQDPIDPVGVVNSLVFVGPIATRDGKKLTIATA